MAKPKVKIPPRVRVTAKRDYEVLFVDDFKDGKTLGECRYDPPQIVIKTGQSDRETIKTFIHEMVHAIDAETGVGLTETQVRKLEEGIYRAMRLNKWL